LIRSRSVPFGSALLVAGLLGCVAHPNVPATTPPAPTAATGRIHLDLQGFGQVVRHVQQAPTFATATIGLDGATMRRPVSIQQSFALGAAALDIGGVPAGTNLVLTVQGLDVNNQALPGARYSTTVNVVAGQQATASVGATTTTRADVVAALLASDRLAQRDASHSLAARLDVTTLQAQLDRERPRLGLSAPTLFNANRIALVVQQTSDLTGTGSVSPPIGDYTPFVLAPGQARIWLSGLPVGGTATVWLDDPLSPKQTNLPTGGAIISPVMPGTWSITVQSPDGTQSTASVVVPAGLATSSAQVRFDLGHWELRPPLLTGATGSTTVIGIAGATTATMSLGGATRLVMVGGMDGSVAPNGTTPFATSSCYAFDGFQLTSFPTLPTGVSYAAGTVANGRFVLFGGMKADGTESSDILTSDGTTWQRVSSLIVNGQVSGLTGAACALLGNKIYVFGGSISRFAQAYDPATLAATASVPMNTQRTYPASVVYQGKLYVFGGVNDGGFTSTAEVFDPVAATWTPLTNLPVTRFGGQAVVVGSQIFVIGGMDGNRRANGRVDVYTPATDSWSSYSALNYPRGAVSLGFLTDPLTGTNRLFVVGGSDGLFYQLLNGSLSYEKPIPTSIVEVWRP